VSLRFAAVGQLLKQQGDTRAVDALEPFFLAVNFQSLDNAPAERPVIAATDADFGRAAHEFCRRKLRHPAS
jgi:hypothetical protein